MPKPSAAATPGSDPNPHREARECGRTHGAAAASGCEAAREHARIAGEEEERRAAVRSPCPTERDEGQGGPC